MSEQEDDLEELGNQDIDPRVFQRYAELCEQGAQEQYKREQQTTSSKE